MTRGAPVLVTGATGFIGWHLTRRLAERGHAVRAVDVRPPAVPWTHANVAFQRCDIRDGAALQPLLVGVDTVFHLASVHLEVHASAEAFEDVNVRAAEQLVAWCRAADVRRLIHTSSVGIYGHVERPPAAEDSPKRPQTPYERTKLAGEEAARRRADELGLDLVVLRPAWVYGPGCPRTAKLLRAVQRGRFFYIGDGSNLRHPIFIDDMLDAYELAAAAPAAIRSRAFIIAGPEVVTLRQLVTTCASVLGVAAPTRSLPRPVGVGAAIAAELVFGALRRQPPLSRRSLAFFENDNAFDTGAAQRDLGFRAAVGLADGLRRTASRAGEVAA